MYPISIPLLVTRSLRTASLHPKHPFFHNPYIPKMLTVTAYAPILPLPTTSLLDIFGNAIHELILVVVISAVKESGMVRLAMFFQFIERVESHSRASVALDIWKWCVGKIRPPDGVVFEAKHILQGVNYLFLP